MRSVATRILKLKLKTTVRITARVGVNLLILLLGFGLPALDIAGLPRSATFWGLTALTLSYAAYTAEIYRSGIQSINKGQTEAAKTIGLTYSQTMRYVILPQAIRRILPALGNQLVDMLKMSSLVSVVGMQELTRKANELVVSEYRPLEIYTILVLEYLVLILIVSAGVRWLERRMNASDT